MYTATYKPSSNVSSYLSANHSIMDSTLETKTTTPMMTPVIRKFNESTDQTVVNG